MNFVNETGLPKSMVKALSHSRYQGADGLSATTLLKPPRIVQLEKRHDHEITVDVAERIFAVLGQIGHKIFADVAMDGAIKEERIFMNVLETSVHGQFDCYEDEEVQDIKFTSMYAGKDKPKLDWVWQVNIYAYILRLYGFTTKAGKVICVFRDWSKTQAAMGKHGYPKHQSKVHKVELKPDKEVLEFIKERVRLHREAEALDDNDLPICTPAERWDHPSKFAVMKKGVKRALKLCDSKKEAEDYIENTSASWLKDKKKAADVKKLRWVYRPGKRPRCEMYCNVNRFCNEYQKYLKTKEK